MRVLPHAGGDEAEVEERQAEEPARTPSIVAEAMSRALPDSRATSIASSGSRRVSPLGDDDEPGDTDQQVPVVEGSSVQRPRQEATSPWRTSTSRNISSGSSRRAPGDNDEPSNTDQQVPVVVGSSVQRSHLETVKPSEDLNV